MSCSKEKEEVIWERSIEKEIDWYINKKGVLVRETKKNSTKYQGI